MTRSDEQTAVRAGFKLYADCPEGTWPDCEIPHVFSEDGRRIDCQDFGRTEVFTDKQTGTVTWYVPWKREHVDLWPGTDIVALSRAELS